MHGIVCGSAWSLTTPCVKQLALHALWPHTNTGRYKYRQIQIQANTNTGKYKYNFCSHRHHVQTIFTLCHIKSTGPNKNTNTDMLTNIDTIIATMCKFSN